MSSNERSLHEEVVEALTLYGGTFPRGQDSDAARELLAALADENDRLQKEELAVISHYLAKTKQLEERIGRLELELVFAIDRREGRR